jgi:uncharacterized protein (TIGR02996 family)
MLEEQESFLCAIYDAPDDPTPRLVYADWLEEHGEVAAGQYLRFTSLVRASTDDVEQKRLRTLINNIRQTNTPDELAAGNFFPLATKQKLVLDVSSLESLEAFRLQAIKNHRWFGTISVRLSGHRIADATPFRTLFESAIARHLDTLDVSGQTTSQSANHPYRVVTDTSGSVQGLSAYADDSEYVIRPFFTPRAFSLFIKMKATNRLTHLDLRNNNLDNDALRALAKSPHLNRLQRLYLSEGNTFRGRVWQQVLERFGPDVVE